MAGDGMICIYDKKITKGNFEVNLKVELENKVAESLTSMIYYANV